MFDIVFEGLQASVHAYSLYIDSLDILMLFCNERSVLILKSPPFSCSVVVQ